MKRLTFDGNFCDIAQCTEVPGGSYCEDGACTQRKVWERLKAYEDTRMTPEEITKAKCEFWAVKLLLKGRTASKALELIEAEKEGRIVILPCDAKEKEV